MQLTANNLAQAKMEILKHQEAMEPGVITFTDPISGSFYVEIRVEALPPVQMPYLPSGSQPWHLRLVFKDTTDPLLGNIAQVNIFDAQGNGLGIVSAKTTLPRTGLICELNYNNFIDFKGYNTVRIDSSILQGMGIDLSQPGSEAGSVNVLCVGSLSESLDLYFSGGLIYHNLPRYKVNAARSIGKLNIGLWPGANSYIALTTAFQEVDTVELLDRGFLLSVKVFENHELYQAGEAEIAGLKSIRHQIGEGR
jgi:hypothetical protein